MPGVQQFISEFICSVEQLEILCLLSGSPQRVWSGQDVCRVIQSSEQSVANNLERLLTQGFLVRDGKDLYRYSPRDPRLAEAVEKLTRAYHDRRPSVVEMIYRPRPGTQHAPSDTTR